MAQRLYIRADLAHLADMKQQNIGRPGDRVQWPVADYVAAHGGKLNKDGTPKVRFSYTEDTTSAWCSHYGFTFVPLPDVSEKSS